VSSAHTSAQVIWAEWAVHTLQHK